VNAMTVDVEDYFHVSVFDGLVPRHGWDTMESRVSRNTERLLEIFGESGIQATFFVLGWVAERFPRLVRAIAAQGHEIASHGYGHRLVYDLTPRAFRDDIRRAKDILQSAGSAPVYGYRAPSYSVTPRSLWALDVLIDADDVVAEVGEARAGDEPDVSSSDDGDVHVPVNDGRAAATRGTAAPIRFRRRRRSPDARAARASSRT